MSECLDEHYRIYCDHAEGGAFFVKLLCIDPSGQLQRRLDQARASVFFSATILPIDYYKRLLCEEKAPYAVYAESAFDAARRHVLIGRDVSSAYRRRDEEEYRRFAAYIRDVTAARCGNYMIFGPSYRFLREVYACVEDMSLPGTELLLQNGAMSEEERSGFLARFDERETGRTLLAFCVMGGVFAEGIDLVGERLIGAILLGVGLPMVTHERQIIADHFGREDGFAYAYLYPGMNKVLQAAGRVIRTEDDVGIVALLDERFLRSDYRRIFPREWQDVAVVTENLAREDAAGFWKLWQ